MRSLCSVNTRRPFHLPAVFSASCIAFTTSLHSPPPPPPSTPPQDYTLIHYDVNAWEGRAYEYGLETLRQQGVPVDGEGRGGSRSGWVGGGRRDGDWDWGRPGNYNRRGKAEEGGARRRADGGGRTAFCSPAQPPGQPGLCGVLMRLRHDSHEPGCDVHNLDHRRDPAFQLTASSLCLLPLPRPSRRSSGLRFDPDLVIRGLIMDKEFGNLIKVDRFG